MYQVSTEKYKTLVEFMFDRSFVLCTCEYMFEFVKALNNDSYISSTMTLSEFSRVPCGNFTTFSHGNILVVCIFFL